MDNDIIIFSQNCRGGLSVANHRHDLFHYVKSNYISLLKKKFQSERYIAYLQNNISKFFIK